MKLLKRFLGFAALGIFFSSSAYATALSIVPPNGSSLPSVITNGQTLAVTYTVINNTNRVRNNNFIKYLPPNVTVDSTPILGSCGGSTFTLQPNGIPGDRCDLHLFVNGPVDGNDADPHHHLFVCFPGGKTCSGTAFGLNVANGSSRARYIAVGDDNTCLAPGDGTNIYTFIATVTGQQTPLFDLSDPSFNNISLPGFVFLDNLNHLWISNAGINKLSEYAYPANGSPVPLRTITDTLATSSEHQGIGKDGAGFIYAAYSFSSPSSINVFSPNASDSIPGSTTPVRIIDNVGAVGNLVAEGLWVTADGTIYVVLNNFAGTSRIDIYAPGATTGSVPQASISSPALNDGVGIWLDFSGNIWVANGGTGNGTPSILEFPAGSTGSVQPIININGSATTLGAPRNLAVDALGYIYVADSTSSSSGTGIVKVFAPSANGNVVPVQTINLPASTCIAPGGLTISY